MSRFNIPNKFKFLKKSNKENNFNRCNHHTALKVWEKKCQVDEWAKQYGYCQEHICSFCKGNLTTNARQKILDCKGKAVTMRNEKDEEVINYHCNGRNKGKRNKLNEYINYHCGEIYLNLLIDEKKVELIDNKIDTIFRLAQDDIESGFKDKIKTFLDKLTEKEGKLLVNNFSRMEPFFNEVGLQEIGKLIEGCQNTELTDGEKSDLKLLYSGSAGNTQNIIKGKIKFFAEKGQARKNKKDLEKAEDDREREREREPNPDTPLPDNPPNPPEEPNPDQPNPKPEPTPSPQPSPNGPSDNSQQELNEIKQRIKTTYNLTEEEFNIIIFPLTNKDLLEHVSLLLGKVKEVQNKKITDKDSCLEFLMSYRNSSTDSINKRAYEAVNGYQQQVDQIIDDLQSKKQATNASLSELVKSKNEEGLELIYNEIKKDPEIYQDEDARKIDNHYQRVHDAIEIENKPQATDLEKYLAVKLRSIINSDCDKNTLEDLKKELSKFKSPSSEEKKTIYNTYCESIDLILQEIESELTRREQSKKDQEKTPPSDSSKKSSSENKKTTIPLVIIIAGVSITLITFSIYVALQYRKKILKRNKNKKQ